MDEHRRYLSSVRYVLRDVGLGRLTGAERQALLDALDAVSQPEIIALHKRMVDEWTQWRESARLTAARAEQVEARLDEAYRHGREHEGYDRDGEIMDLTAERDRLRRDTRFIRRQVEEQQELARKHYDRAERAEAERDRYREALERIVDPKSQIVVMDDGHPSIVPGRLREIARAALSADAQPSTCDVPKPGGSPVVCRCQKPLGHTGPHEARDGQGVLRWWGSR